MSTPLYILICESISIGWVHLLTHCIFLRSREKHPFKYIYSISIRELHCFPYSTVYAYEASDFKKSTIQFCSSPGIESGPSPDHGNLCQFLDGLPLVMVRYCGLASEGRQRYKKMQKVKGKQIYLIEVHMWVQPSTNILYTFKQEK